MGIGALRLLLVLHDTTQTDSTRTNGDGMGVNKGATWAPAGGLREVVDLQRNTSVGKLVERIL